MPTESTAPLGRIAWYCSHGIGGRPPSDRGGLRTMTRFVAQTARTPASSGGMHLYLRGPLDARGGRSLRSFAVIFRIVSEAPLTWHRLLNERRIEPEIAQEGPGLGALCSGTSAKCAPTSALGRPAPRVARLAHLLARTAPRTAKAPRVAGPSQTPGQGLEPQSPGPEPGVTANWTIPDSVLAVKNSQSLGRSVRRGRKRVFVFRGTKANPGRVVCKRPQAALTAPRGARRARSRR